MRVVKITDGSLPLQIPDELRSKLSNFRQRVWSVKTAEAVFAVISVLMLSYAMVFIGDRLVETPAWLRLVLFLAGVSGIVLFLPWKLHRWIWRNRNFTDVARLLARSQPRIGDRLLGIIELAQNTHDRNASHALCQAAIQQVADDARGIDLGAFVPQPTHRTWGRIAALASALGIAALLVPGAGLNALQRWARPFADIPRYTFAQLAPLPDRMVVPLGEPFTLVTKLSGDTVWSPRRGTARYGGPSPIRTDLAEGGFQFDFPPQTVPTHVSIAVGDARHRLLVDPKSRPELTALVAQIEMPEYLAHSNQKRDVRSGAVSMVRGSRARFEATANRPLVGATINGESDEVEVQGATIKSPLVSVDEPVTQEFRWTDVEGLSSKAPFQLRVRAVEDRAPSVQCQDLAPEKVVLDEETLSFQVVAQDDFGIKNVGIEWSGVEDPRENPDPEKGEYLLATGGPLRASVAAQGTFTAKRLGVKPQPVHLRVYAEDFLPGRDRTYSAVYRLYVVDRQQHMIWITERLQQWERQALEVRDQEQRLLETNLALQELGPEELDQEASRQRIARQAAAERANAQRLAALTSSGEQLISEATRNAEFNVATLEQWAKMLQVLKQLSSRRMPSVANLLGEAANAPASSSSVNRPTAPSVTDEERGLPEDPNGASKDSTEGDKSTPKGSVLGLPDTVLTGRAPERDTNAASCPTDEKIDQAVEEQTELMAEFNRVMGELAKLLQDLQGSTFVKRLKAAARNELTLASSLHNRLQQSFGRNPVDLPEDDQALLRQIDRKQLGTVTNVHLIQEDLTAYFERTQRSVFKTVGDEMKETKIVANLKQMASAVNRNRVGETIAQAEYWSDQLDRWAEILVGPG